MSGRWLMKANGNTPKTGYGMDPRRELVSGLYDAAEGGAAVDRSQHRRLTRIEPARWKTEERMRAMTSA